MHEIRPTTRRLAWSAVAVAGLALFGGCGDDDDTSSDDTASDATSDDTASDDTASDDTASDDTSGGAGAVLVAGYAFDPTPVTVQAGDTVTWTNDDEFAHTSTSDDADVWDSGDLAQGDSFEFTFDEPGTYAYHCDIHNFMEGTVVVE